jgi:cell division protease FtsH
MLNALRNNRNLIQLCDLDTVMNKMLMGWQPNEHQFSEDIIDRIAIHEMGHAVVGLMSKNHAKVTKVSINLFSPTTPGFTLFEGTTSAIYTKESLFEHLMILLAGRIAEEEFYDVSTTTGATMDFEEAFKLAEKMVLYYGMGRKSVIYPSNSDRYKELIDDEVLHIIHSAYKMSKTVIQQNRGFVKRGADALKTERVLKAPRLAKLLQENDI